MDRLKMQIGQEHKSVLKTRKSFELKNYGST